MMTKEDYMKLSKEKLAELLVERDREPAITMPYTPRLQCYEPDGVCTNPQMDCINCPRRNMMGNGHWTVTTINDTKDITLK